MSRYRPPRPAGTALITPEGEARLRAELHELWHVRRPQVTQAVSEAAAQGEGVARDTEPCDHARRSCEEVHCLGPTHRAAFADLWNQINGADAWNANPWVWVVEFKAIEAKP